MTPKMTPQQWRKLYILATVGYYCEPVLDWIPRPRLGPLFALASVALMVWGLWSVLVWVHEITQAEIATMIQALMQRAGGY